jgi:cell division protein FtsL
VLASLLAVGGAHAYLTAGQVRLARLQQQLESAQTTERGLEVQVAQLEDPSRVVNQAQQQGLTVPSQVTDLPLVGSATGSDSTRKR